MQKLNPRLFLLPLMLLATLLFAVPASAADGWLPAHFDANHRVYVDPALSNNPSYPVNLDGLEAQLDKASHEQGIEFYFVVTQKGSGTVPSQYNGKYARWQLDDLINRWSSQSGFTANKTLVIMLVRSDRNPNAFAWAVNPGSDVKANGLNDSFYSDSYLEGLRNKYLPNDIRGYAVHLAQDSNGQVHGVIAHREFVAALPMYIGSGVVLLLLLGGFGFLFVRYTRAASALKSELDKWAPKMDSVTTLFQQLNDPAKGYLDFLSDQKGRRASFAGDTKTKYEAALKDYSAFVIRRQLAADLYQAAKAAYEGRKFIVSAGSLASAYASLTTTQVVITGSEKKLTDITDVFGGTVEKWSKNPEELLADINKLFGAVNKALGEIMAAFEGASANKTAIATTLAEVDKMEAKVTEAGLNFEPFRTREAGIKTEAGTVLADITGNPIGKLTDSTRINDAVADLKGDIEKCIQIKGALPAMLAGITTVRGRVAQVRGTATALAYPFIEGEKAGKEAGATFLLAEKDHNPDDSLNDADEHAKASEAALQAGEWEQAKEAKEAADAATKAANALVDAALAAKEYIEQHVQIARAAKSALSGKIPAAHAAADTLKGTFLAANFKGQPEKVETAQTVANGSESTISTVRAAYFAQDFVSARATLETLEGNIAGADKGLSEVHAKLAELERLRQKARTTAADAVSKSTALKSKRQDKQFTTAAATDKAHSVTMQQVATLKANTDQDVADWPALAEEADQVVAQLVALDGQVDAAEAAYGQAQLKVAAVSASVDSAARACAQSDVLRPAKDKLEAARAQLTALQNVLETPKSNWVQLGRDADEKKNVADGAKQLALQDVEDAKNARTAYAAAETLLNQNSGSTVRRSKRGGYKNQEFTKTVSVNLSDADSALSAAEQCLRNRQWKEAKRYADSVKGKISDAEDAAERLADQQVQQLIVVWIQQNPEPAPTPTYNSGSGSSNNDFGSSIGQSIGNQDSGFSGGGGTGGSIGGQDSNF